MKQNNFSFIETKYIAHIDKIIFVEFSFFCVVANLHLLFL